MNGAGGSVAGWHAWPTAFLGVIVSMVAILLPSSGSSQNSENKAR
jgi:hypothetical protein